MSNKICVYTCITGNYDNLNEITHPEPNIDYYCFTNNKNLKSKTWKIIQIQNDSLDNHRLSRQIKILGHPIINEKYQTAVWIDADITWLKPISDFVKKYFKNTSFAIFKHHSRTTIRDEAITCLIHRKDTKASITRTLDYYHTIGFPDNNGLAEATVFIKNPKDPQVIKTMSVWFDMVKNYSKRDQLSFIYSVWQTGLKISLINLNVWNNQWFTYKKHNPRPDITRCDIYYGNPEQDFDFDKYYSYDLNQTEDTYSISATIPTRTSEITIVVTDIPGVEYSDIQILPRPKKINALRSISHQNHNMFYTTNSAIIAQGNFVKDQKLNFSIRMKIMDHIELVEFSEMLWNYSHTLLDQINTLNKANHELQQNQQQLQAELEKIINSKGWQTLEKARKITSVFKSRH